MTGRSLPPTAPPSSPGPNAEPSTTEEIRLSAFVISRDERTNIDRCLASLRFCDEIVVLDSGSTDGTVEAARAHAARVFVETWRGYGPQKQRALELCRGTWALSVDADEVVSPGLAEEIRTVADDTGGGPSSFALRRRVRYLGRWIRHGGWGSDWVVRLVRREGSRFSDARVHERIVVSGRPARLSGILEHHSYRDLDHHWEKIRELSRLWAEEARAAGRRAGAVDLALRPPGRFLRIYLLKLGFLDGWRGLVIAWMGAAYVLMKYARLMAQPEGEAAEEDAGEGGGDALRRFPAGHRTDPGRPRGAGTGEQER